MSTQGESEAPARVRPTWSGEVERLAGLLETALSRKDGEPSASVEITRNAKGEPQFSVKVYATANAADEDVKRATEHAYDQAVQAFDALTAKLPFGG